MTDQPEARMRAEQVPPSYSPTLRELIQGAANDAVRIELLRAERDEARAQVEALLDRLQQAGLDADGPTVARLRGKAV